MSDDRPAVPKPLVRRLKEEAGYRCAIPRCGGTVRLEMAHIEPWAKVKEHTFENMICLCADCHWRYDQRDEIPKASILQFKRNLSLLSHRYTQVEQQILRHYAKLAASGLTPADHSYVIHSGMWLLFTNLLEDELIRTGPMPGQVVTRGPIVQQDLMLLLTPTGSDFIMKMVAAEDLET